MAWIDASLAARIGVWGCWSRQRIVNAVDAAVRLADPAAAKERRVNADTERRIRVAAQPNGMARLHGTLSAPVAAVVDKRLSEMAAAVCRGDGRSIDQRRADALYALAEGRGLTCDCGQADCCATVAGPAAPSRFVITAIAGLETLSGDPDQKGCGHPGYLEGYGVIDADQVRQLAETAVVRPLSEPTVTDEQAVRYQPTGALAAWVRARSLTCSFPGCDRPAWRADLDHSVPFDHTTPPAGGKTVDTNLDPKCREHHRLKTFHGDPAAGAPSSSPMAPS